jgi:biotin operon repressor
MRSDEPFAKIPKDVLYDPTISMAAKVTYAIIESFGWKTGEANAYQRTIAEKLGCTDRAVRNYLEELKSRGLIEVERRGKQLANVTRLLAPSDRNGRSDHSNKVTGTGVPITPEQAFLSPRNERSSHSGTGVPVHIKQTGAKKTRVKQTQVSSRRAGARDAAASSPANEAGTKLLRDFGVDGADKLANSRTIFEIRAAIERAASRGANPAGFAAWLLGSTTGKVAPDVSIRAAELEKGGGAAIDDFATDPAKIVHKYASVGSAFLETG